MTDRARRFSIRNLPFKHQLTLILTLTSCLALLVASAAFMTYDLYSYRLLMVRDLSTLGEVIGANSTAAIAFNDARAAEELLAALRAKPNIVAGVLYARDGTVFARYTRDGGPLILPPGGPEVPGYHFAGRYLHLNRPIRLDGEVIGNIYIRSDTLELRARVQHYALAVGLVLAISVLATLLLSARLQGVVSRPLLRLAAAARSVSVDKNYLVRVPVQGRDELALLTGAFNEMLSQIQARDAALQGAQVDLEKRVEERTLELRREVNERLQAEEALRRSEEQLRQSQKMEAVGCLAGGIAHDFNNLLTAIAGYSQLLLLRLKPGDALRNSAEEIVKASDRATALTRQLLAFSRKQMLEPKVLDLNTIVASMHDMMRRLIGENIHLVTAAAPDLGRVRADPGQLEQVIMNLAVNARDAMPAGGTITLETRDVDLDDRFARSHAGSRPGPHVMLTVRDTGCGMDAETQSRIFEPFFTTKEKGKGTGLGLSTVYGIVKQSGGYIWVESAPGRGATFTIYLPRVEEAAESARPQPAAGAPRRGTETVLLVEDEDVVRQLTHDILRMHGYTVLSSADGDGALALCAQHPGDIHLMLTDVVMPRMNGRELYARAAPLRATMRVLYMSGYTDGMFVHQGALEPGTAFIQKPFTPDSLAAKVRQVLDAHGNN